MTTWFEKLVGFRESRDAVLANLEVNGAQMNSRVNGKTFACGTFSTPMLSELRKSAEGKCTELRGELSMHQIVADAGALHADAENAGAMFQAASQFNVLEMVGPSVSPDEGVANYENDLTQGPACAVAAGAATIYRNYFADVGGQLGQTAERQIDCLADMGRALGNEGSLWTMQNGYAMFTDHGAKMLNTELSLLKEDELDALRDTLRIGVHEGVEVTLEGAGHLVSQAYCSTVPVGYNTLSSETLAPFAKLILQATYEATLAAAITNYAQSGSPSLYLTLIGGGVFANDETWILDAIERAARRYRDVGLEVFIVSYRQPSPRVSAMIDRFRSARSF